MTKQFYFFLISICLLSFSVSAQQLINGNLEPATPSAFSSGCGNTSITNFNTNMGNVTAIGSFLTIEVSDNTCSDGHAHAGSYYVGVTYSSAGYNTLVFKLDAPMVAGTSYALDFYHMTSSLAFSNIPLKFGYSTSATTADSFGGNIPSTDSMTWQLAHGTFIPKVAAQYVWIAAAGSSTGSVYIDDIHLRNNTAVNNINVNSGIELYPNPMTTAAKLKMDASIGLPCSMVIYDITGRSVITRDNISSRELTINKDDLGTGMFLIKLTDRTNRSVYSKLIAQ